MSLAYPIARSLDEATRPGVKTARTLREAAASSPGARVELDVIVALPKSA